MAETNASLTRRLKKTTEELEDANAILASLESILYDTELSIPDRLILCADAIRSQIGEQADVEELGVKS